MTRGSGTTEQAAITRIGAASAPDPAGSDPPDPSARELRDWARANGVSVA